MRRFTLRPAVHSDKPTRRERLKRQLIPVIPTLLTLGNAVCGLGSITCAMKAAPGSPSNTALFSAGLLIFIAMIFDMLDGSVARWTRQTSKFGAELDSLCDAISFGVAPAFILLQISEMYHPRILWVIAALYMVCTVLRLARFNVDTSGDDDHSTFKGLPSPAAAATVASFAMVAPNARSLMLPETARFLVPSEASVIAVVRNALPLIALVLAGLMVSRVRYPHLVNQALRGRRHFRQLIQIVFAIAAIVALGELAAPLLICTFVAASPLGAAWQRFLIARSLTREGGVDSPAPIIENVAPTVAEKPNLQLALPKRKLKRR